MTIGACEHAEMFAVFKGQRSEIGNGDRYGINRVTDRTIFQLRSFWIFLVVAGPAGFPFFHFGHRNSRIVFTGNMKNRIMAGRTVITKAFKMIFMTERNISGALGFNKQSLLEISGNRYGKGNNDNK